MICNLSTNTLVCSFIISLFDNPCCRDSIFNLSDGLIFNLPRSVSLYTIVCSYVLLDGEKVDAVLNSMPFLLLLIIWTTSLESSPRTLSSNSLICSNAPGCGKL